jgi:F-type H+-transporting ATPase subunit b
MLFLDPETWVAIAFILLVIGFAWMGVHRTVLTALDHRAERIKAELDDASRLKDEAAKVLAEYKARRASAEREAADIIASANAEAERIASEAKTKMEDFVARRTKTAESKIALAEAQAVADVRAAAADAAVQAASTILSQSVKGSLADDLLAKGIAEVRQKLNSAKSFVTKKSRREKSRRFCFEYRFHIETSLR